jgi:hypothetical protein
MVKNLFHNLTFLHVVAILVSLSFIPAFIIGVASIWSIVFAISLGLFWHESLKGIELGCKKINTPKETANCAVKGLALLILHCSFIILMPQVLTLMGLHHGWFEPESLSLDQFYYSLLDTFIFDELVSTRIIDNPEMMVLCLGFMNSGFLFLIFCLFTSPLWALVENIMFDLPISISNQTKIEIQKNRNKAKKFYRERGRREGSSWGFIGISSLIIAWSFLTPYLISLEIQKEKQEFVIVLIQVFFLNLWSPIFLTTLIISIEHIRTAFGYKGYRDFSFNEQEEIK